MFCIQATATTDAEMGLEDQAECWWTNRTARFQASKHLYIDNKGHFHSCTLIEVCICALCVKTFVQMKRAAYIALVEVASCASCLALGHNTTSDSTQLNDKANKQCTLFGLSVRFSLVFSQTSKHHQHLNWSGNLSQEFERSTRYNTCVIIIYYYFMVT